MSSHSGGVGDALNLPQFNGHFEKEYTTILKGVSNEKQTIITTIRAQAVMLMVCEVNRDDYS